MLQCYNVTNGIEYIKSIYTKAKNRCNIFCNNLFFGVEKCYKTAQKHPKTVNGVKYLLKKNYSEEEIL